MNANQLKAAVRLINSMPKDGVSSSVIAFPDKDKDGKPDDGVITIDGTMEVDDVILEDMDLVNMFNDEMNDE